MSKNEISKEESGEEHNTSSRPVTERPTKELFSLMEHEAGGVSPEPSNITDSNREFVYNDVNSKDYHSSNFPSLLSHLGPNAKHKTKRNKKKTIFSDMEPKDEKNNEKGHVKRHKDDLTFAEQMKRHNEARWLRIEAVAKEKMDYYDKYMSEMALKIKQQRAKINQRTTQLLTALQKQEEKKKEERLYDSPFGRMWRHHRTMQRRAFSLEPIRPQKIS